MGGLETSADKSKEHKNIIIFRIFFVKQSPSKIIKTSSPQTMAYVIKWVAVASLALAVTADPAVDADASDRLIVETVEESDFCSQKARHGDIVHIRHSGFVGEKQIDGDGTDQSPFLPFSLIVTLPPVGTGRGLLRFPAVLTTEPSLLF